MNVSNNLKRRLLRNGLLMAAKVIGWVAISYALTVRTDIFIKHPVLANVAYGINTFLTGSILISIARFMFISLYRQRNQRNNRVRGNYVLGINQIGAILNVGFGILGLMLAFGIDPKEFLTSITIVAMAIALLFKDYITNMISGLIIMFSDQFTIGDNVRIGEHKGKIVDITLANIMVKNEDDDVVLIPNNTAFTANIINQSLQNSRKLSMDFELPLAHSYNQDKLASSLQGVIDRYASDIVVGSFQFRVVGVEKDSVHYKLQFFTTKKDSAIRKKIRNDLYQRVIAYDAEQAAQTKG
ncbi:Small-conductance mechanosensitive channel [Parapedobacter composti]|uniref:Small-conductance mechanosensitive channel n=1 Tax=Parapedobacter composti TaxID=623281 RepID=A0A1I1JLF0_9SPHI|nr:mechanosensitive ion channel domain-containing protein [Parapedobacter composti]SFC49397.1 Small-conductance mechanosensitive channel [Parapedobacter composti]